jgi:hypothetical protein
MEAHWALNWAWGIAFLTNSFSSVLFTGVV